MLIMLIILIILIFVIWCLHIFISLYIYKLKQDRINELEKILKEQDDAINEFLNLYSQLYEETPQTLQYTNKQCTNYQKKINKLIKIVEKN